MGSSGSTTHAASTEIKMQKLDVNAQEKTKAEKSLQAPSSGYASFVTERPSILPAVAKTISEQKKLSALRSSSEQGQRLPVYQLSEMKGCYYEGEWKKGKQNGKGIVYSRDGHYYEGPFLNGQAAGDDGLFVFPDGSYYRGTFKNNKFNGAGKYVYKYNNTTYEGNWLDNLPNGHGTETFLDKSVTNANDSKTATSTYVGDFVAGKKEGQGTFTWWDGRKYVGHFKNGYMEGQGTLTQRNGYFKGTFEKGLKKQGELKTEYGQYYGKFVNGDMHDPAGRFVWNDGKEYKGGFEFNQLHGSGAIKYPNGGNTAAGEWERGENKIVNTVSK